MPFTLTLLGTDTNFSPGAADGYDKAETLSYVSTLIDDTSTGSTDDVVRFRNNKVAVINGPSTLGIEIGDRIARGVTIILEAISRGETDISIIAHSRGAVEAILVAHELERIQNILKQSSEFNPELNNSECAYTKAALTKEPHKSTFEGLNWDAISKEIDNVKLSMLNIDPVPGGNYVGLTYTTTLAWRDPRFYKLPEIVSEYEQYLYENERTRCFKPIVPKCVSEETKFKLTSLPGHHGTGSGNLRDQQRRQNPNNQDTSHVQELCLVKLMDFLSRNGVALKRKASDTDPFDLLMEQFFAESPEKDKKLKQIYLKLFDNIVKNRANYEHYNKTFYATLGQEQGILAWIPLYSIINQRIVHFEGHNDTFLETIIPPIPGKKFLNFEHARLYINKRLGLSDAASLSQTINTAAKSLLRLCEQCKSQEDIKKLDNDSLTESAIDREKLVYVVATKEGFKLLLEGLSTLIDEVRQSYLQKIVDDEERSAVYDAIHNSFKNFEKYTSEHTEHEIAKNIFTHFKEHLKNTLDSKRDILITHNEMLTKRMQDKNPLQGFQDNIQKVIDSIEEKKSDLNEAESLLVNNLNKVIEKIKAKTFTKTESIKQFLESECCIFEKMNIANEEGNKLAIEIRGCVLAFFIEAAEDSQPDKIEDIIQEVINLANELEQYKDTIPHFTAFDSSYDYDTLEKTLTQQLDQLINLTGKYIAEQKIPLDSIESLFEDNNLNLYKRIKYNAIGRGAEDPLVLDFEKKLALVEEEQRLLIAELTKSQKEQAKLINDFNSREEELKKLNKELSLAKQQTTNEVQNFAQQVNVLNAELTVLKSQQNTATDVLDDETEFELNKIIINKLYPLTKNYLLSLAQEVKHKIAPNLNITDYSELASTIEKWPQDESLQILKQKIGVLCELKKILTSQNPASKKVNLFYENLNAANTTLAKHRDPGWIRFTKNAAIVLSIILTGILPGLFVLGAITLAGDSPKFWQSSGQTFFQKASQEITDNNSFLNSFGMKVEPPKFGGSPVER